MDNVNGMGKAFAYSIRLGMPASMDFGKPTILRPVYLPEKMANVAVRQSGPATFDLVFEATPVTSVGVFELIMLGSGMEIPEGAVRVGILNFMEQQKLSIGGQPPQKKLHTLMLYMAAAGEETMKLVQQEQAARADQAGEGTA